MEENNQSNTNSTVATSPIMAAGPEPVVVVDAVTALPTPPAAPAPETATTVVEADSNILEAKPVRQNYAPVIKQYSIALGIVLVMGVGLLYALEQQGRVHTGIFTALTEIVTPTPVAATVNGVDIPLASYEKNLKQLEEAAVQQGNDIENESIKSEISTQAIDVLVNTELLRQAAAAAGIAVTPEQIDARYAEIMTGLGGEAQLQTKMAELGITPESLRTDIEGEILIQTHLTAAVDVSTIVIDPKEVLAVYEQANTAEAKLPPFEQVKPDIESQLRFTKEQELVNAYIQSLRDTAEIKTNI